MPTARGVLSVLEKLEEQGPHLRNAVSVRRSLTGETS